jgi:hypothetical protein
MAATWYIVPESGTSYVSLSELSIAKTILALKAENPKRSNETIGAEFGISRERVAHADPEKAAGRLLKSVRHDCDKEAV